MNGSQPPSWKRMLQFSITTLLLLVTALCVWLGISMERARAQKQIVEAFRREGGIAVYDYQLANSSIRAEPDSPKWLRQVFGIDFFHDVESLQLAPNGNRTDGKLLTPKQLQWIQAFPRLRVFATSKRVSGEQLIALTRIEGIEKVWLLDYGGDLHVVEALRRENPSIVIQVGQPAAAKHPLHALRPSRTYSYVPSK